MQKHDLIGILVCLCYHFYNHQCINSLRPRQHARNIANDICTIWKVHILVAGVCILLCVYCFQCLPMVVENTIFSIKLHVTNHFLLINVRSSSIVFLRTHCNFDARFMLQSLRDICSDVIMNATVSQITGASMVCAKVCSSADKGNIKAPRHWPLWREFTGDRWITLTNGQ